MNYRKILFTLLLVFPFLIMANSYVPGAGKRIYIQDDSYSVIAYIEADGTIYSNCNSVMGYINSDGSILNSSYGSLGYIESDGRILDSSYDKIAYLNKDGTVLDITYNPIAYIRSGYVLNRASSRIMVFDEPVNREWIAVFLIFFY